jgi:hypothetical protein
MPPPRSSLLARLPLELHEVPVSVRRSTLSWRGHLVLARARLLWFPEWVRAHLMLARVRLLRGPELARARLLLACARSLLCMPPSPC